MLKEPAVADASPPRRSSRRHPSWFAKRVTSMDNPLAEQVRALTDQIRNWWERTPRAQRAYEKLSADVDAVVARVETLVDETEALKDLRNKIGAVIDPLTTRPDAAVDASATPPAVEADASPPPLPGSTPPTSGTVEPPTPSTADPTSGTIEA